MNYGPYTGCAPQMGYSNPGAGPGYALSPYYGGGMAYFGAEPAAPATFMEKVKAEAVKETYGIKRWQIGLGAVAIGGIWYAHSKRMF